MAKRIVKNNHNTTLGKALADLNSAIYSWKDLLKPDPFIEWIDKKDWRERLCCYLLAWAAEENSIALQGFCNKIHLRRDTFYSWTQKYPDIKQAYEDAKLMMAYNREYGVATKKLDGHYMYLNIEDYDPAFTAVLARAEARKKKDDIQQKYLIVSADIWHPAITSKEEVTQQTLSYHKPKLIKKKDEELKESVNDIHKHSS